MTGVLELNTFRNRVVGRSKNLWGKCFFKYVIQGLLKENVLLPLQPTYQRGGGHAPLLPIFEGPEEATNFKILSTALENKNNLLI